MRITFKWFDLDLIKGYYEKHKERVAPYREIPSSSGSGFCVMGIYRLEFGEPTEKAMQGNVDSFGNDARTGFDSGFIRMHYTSEMPNTTIYTLAQICGTSLRDWQDTER